MTFISYRLHPDKTQCQGSLNAYVHPQPHCSTHTWKQTQGPDAQHAEVSGVESLTGLTNRSLLQSPAHRTSLHTHTEWLISSLSTPPRMAAAQLTATFITLEQLSFYTLWAHGETNQDGFKIGQLWALTVFQVFTLPRGETYCRDPAWRKAQRAETDCLSVLKLVWLWQRAVLLHAACQSTLDLSLALTSASCFGWSVSTMDRGPVGTAWPLGPHPDTQTKRKHWKKIKRLPVSLLSRAPLKHGGKHTLG